MADPLQVVPRIVRRSQPVQQPEPQEQQPEEALTVGDRVLNAGKSVGSAALSGLSMVGNALDLLPSMARDVLVFDNPFDQFLDPLSHSNTGRSATGRDVLARNILTSWLFTPNKETGMSGWLDDPLEGVQDVLGFALEMGTGGFTKVPGAIIKGIKGVKAADAASDLAKAAGVSDDIMDAVSAAKAVKAGTAGDVVADAAPGLFGKITRAAGKVGNTLNELDPGTHVGRAIEKHLGGFADKTRRSLVFGPERKRVAGMLSGVANSQEEADAILRVAEARAMTWAKEQPGRTPDEYFKGFEDIRKSEPGQVGGDALQQNPSGYRSEPFYSKIMEAVDAGKIPNKVGKDQLLKTLTGYGVKQEELADMQKELDSLFAASPDGKVSKDQVFDLAADKSFSELETTELSGYSTQYQGYQVAGGNPDTYREILLRHPSAQGVNNHFDGYNDVIAHIRLDDLDLPNGNKALRIQEIQSDLHQRGAKQGYNNIDMDDLRPVQQENGWRVEDGRGDTEFDNVVFSSQDEARAAITQWYHENGLRAPDVVVPDAAFKKSWHELALKTVVRKAAEEGYGSVALVRGQDIANVVGGPPDALGKFYDEKLNNTLKKLVKKHGGKVENVFPSIADVKFKTRNFGDGVRWEADLPNGKFATIHKSAGKWVADMHPFDSHSENVIGYFDTAEEAKQWLKSVGQTSGYTTFEIPQALRDEVLQKGQALYQKPAGSSPKGAIEFLDDNRAVIHAFQSADISTLAHELGHKFRRDIPENLLREASQALGVTDPQNWAREHEEAFASGFERYLRDGSAPTTGLAKVFEKFKEWMTNIYQSITGTPLEQSVNPQLRAVFDQMLGGQLKPATQSANAGDAMKNSLASFDPLALTGPQATPSSAANQIDDPILNLAGKEAPLAPADTIRGKLDRIGAKLTEMDPGTHVGRAIEKKILDLSDRFTLPQIYEQQVTQRFLKTRFGKIWSEREAAKAASRASSGVNPNAVPSGTGTPTGIHPNMTAQSELAYLMGTGSVARGSRILTETELTPAQDLATRIGEAFGGQVLFWGGGDKRSPTRGVRVTDTGSRIWVNADAGADAYNNIVGHELMHLLRDVSTDAFDGVVKVIQHHAPSEELAKQTEKYLKDYRAATGKELSKGMHLEEGVARTVQAAFDRPVFWDELLQNPDLAEPVKASFTQAMEKLRTSGKVTAQEFEVLDRELSAFIFGQADTMAAGATKKTLLAAQVERNRLRSDVESKFTGTEVDPLADAFATPGTVTHRAIANVEDLVSRINAGIQQNMNYKVGGHTYPVVQSFSRDRTNLSEAMSADVSLPAISAAETAHRLVDSLPETDAIAALAKHEEDIVSAIEKNDFSKLHPDLHPAVKQMQLAQRALYEREFRSGVKVEKLADDYVEYFRHSLHPEVRKKLLEVDAASSNRSPADLAATHKATQSSRTDLFRNAWNGRATWNIATSDHEVLAKLKETALGNKEVRFEAAADVLRQKYLADIDPRIPVVRDDQYIFLQKLDDGTMKPVAFSVADMKRLERVPSQHDLTTEAGRIAEHTNEPISYIHRAKDDAGNEIITEFEQLTARLPGDHRYGNPLADPKTDPAGLGFYRDAEEGADRFRVLSGWMGGKVGTDTLEKTAGVFSGSALKNWQETMQAKTNTLAVAESMPKFIANAVRGRFISMATEDALKSGEKLKLSEVFKSPYFSILERQNIYLRAATLDPGLGKIASKMKAKEFMKVMDDLTVDPEIMRDLKLAGSYMQNIPALENATKPFQSAGSLWKAGVLTHPGRYVRDMLSGLMQLAYGGRFSHSAADAARNVIFNQPVAELLHYDGIKNYLDRMELEHTPENATRAARVMFGNFMNHSGGSIYRDYTDAAAPAATASRGIDSILDALPGDGRSGVVDMVKGAAQTAIGKQGDTTFNPFDIAGVQHLFDKTDAAGQVIAKAGDVRTESKFAPVVAGDIVGKHTNDVVRLAGFIEGLRRGEAPVDAWKAVDWNQLNYNPRTFGPIESKLLKKIFPFYSFMSRETAWVAHELLTNPTGRLGKIIQLTRHSQPSNDFLPDHITEGVAIPLREQEDGTQNYLTGMGLMFEDPLKILGNALSGDPSQSARDILSRSNPILKGVAELGLGRSSFQGGPLGGRDIADMDPVGGRILTQLGLQKERPGGQAAPMLGSPGLEFLLSNSPVSRILSSTKTLLDDRKNVLERAANVLTGLRITSVSPEQKQRGIRELTNAISKELGARPFTTFHISDELLEDAKESDPEKYATLLRIKEMRKEWDKQQRIKRKERAAAQ